MKRDALFIWGIVIAFILGILLVSFGADESMMITDERGCQVQSHSDNRIFGEDTYTVQTYCPVEAKND